MLVMKILKEENAQGSAELLMIFGGMIIIVLVAATVYRNYSNGLGSNLNNGQDMQSIKGNLTIITQKLNGTYNGT